MTPKTNRGMMRLELGAYLIMEKGTQQKTSNQGQGALSGLFDPPASNGEGKSPFGSSTPLAPISKSELERQVARLQRDKAALESYSGVQDLQLVELQKKLLDGITEEKIEAASLTEITKAFATLKDKQLVMGGKATQITGIVGYLIHLEKEEIEKREQEKQPEVVNMEEGSFTVHPVEETPYQEAEYTEHQEQEDEDLPRL